jgi:hypothetical protein
MANHEDTKSKVSHVRSDVSWASAIRSIRCLEKITDHMTLRQKQRRISDALVKEVIADGLITDQRDSRLLHVADHAIVISEDGLGITTYPNPLLGEWRAESADRSTALTSSAKNLETAYFFFQVCSGMYPLKSFVRDGAVLSIAIVTGRRNLLLWWSSG